jgi:pimeloyl-ACP methyl ester carboxylesterase
MTPTPLRHREAGAADSRDVLLLVHGFPFHAGMWRPQLDAPPPGWRVIAPDLPGFGGSAPVAAEALTMDDAADQLALLVNTLGLERVVLAGLSMGGYVSFALLRRYPALVRALVLCDTRAGVDTEETRRGRRQAAARVLSAGTAGFVGDMLPKLLSPASRQRRPGVEAEVRDIMDSAPAAAVAAALHGMADRQDSTPLLRAVTVPALVIVGADDGITPPAEAEGMARDIPGATLEVVPDAGHLPNLENPEAFDRALHRFLATLP